MVAFVKFVFLEFFFLSNIVFSGPCLVCSQICLPVCYNYIYSNYITDIFFPVD
jgi:hypothetical protein